jgi:hypothetical protein
MLVGKPEGKNHLEDLSVDKRFILEWIWGGKLWTRFIWLRAEYSGGLL